MQTFRGGCHCGAVRFEIDAAPTRASRCNCSICTKKGALHHRVPPERFRLIAGEGAVGPDRFGTGTARHRFCRHCGIHPFSNPRLAPDDHGVNIHCLDDFAELAPEIEIGHFDGLHREEAFRALNARG